MLVTITQFSVLARDKNGALLPMGNDRIGCQALTDDGAFTALSCDARFVRIATDTSIQMDIAGGTTGDQSELIPAGTIDFFAVNGKEVFTIQEVLAPAAAA